jgi:hypothetical protein
MEINNMDNLTGTENKDSLTINHAKETGTRDLPTGKRGRPRTKPFVKKYATVDDLDKLTGMIQGIADSFQTILDNKKESPQDKLAEKIVQEEKRDRAEMSPRFNDLINTILGDDFKREMIYPVHGFPKIVITVPENKSNMTDDYKKFYKIDRRTIVIVNGIDSLLLGLKKIRQHLKRPKPDSQEI